MSKILELTRVLPPAPPSFSLQAARQRRQAKELARPRARTCPSEEVISKAKEVASHRPAVVFGISYRGEKDRSDDYTSSAAYLPAASLSSRADAPPSPPAHGRHHQRQERLFNTAAADGFGPRDGLLDGDGGRGSGDGGNRERLRRSNVEDNRGAVTADEAMLFGNACGGRELMMLHRDDHESRQRSHQEGGEAGASALPPPPPPSALLSSSALMPPSSRCSSKLPTVGARNGYDGTSSSPPASATVVADKGRERIPRTAQGGPGGGGAASAEQSEAVPHKQNQVVDSWLLDVRLETETAGTALRVRRLVLVLVLALGTNGLRNCSNPSVADRQSGRSDLQHNVAMHDCTSFPAFKKTGSEGSLRRFVRSFSHGSAPLSHPVRFC